MPIPPPHIIKEIENELMGLINPPEGWKIKVEVKPYLGYDIGYEIDKTDKVIYIKIYSGRFPQSYEDWKFELADEIKNKMGWGWKGLKWNIIELKNVESPLSLEGAEYRVIDTVIAGNVKDVLKKYMGEHDEIAYTYTTKDGKVTKLYYIIPKEIILKDPTKPPTFENIKEIRYGLPKYGAILETK